MTLIRQVRGFIFCSVYSILKSMGQLHRLNFELKDQQEDHPTESLFWRQTYLFVPTKAFFTFIVIVLEGL